MEFLSPKTKERISKLEAENAELQRQLIEQKGSSSKKTIWPLTVVLVVITALVTYQVVGESSASEEELIQKSIELWRGGQAVDTVFTANDELVFSVQIGAFKNQSIKELSYGPFIVGARVSELPRLSKCSCALLKSPQTYSQKSPTKITMLS